MLGLRRGAGGVGAGLEPIGGTPCAEEMLEGRPADGIGDAIESEDTEDDDFVRLIMLARRFMGGGGAVFFKGAPETLSSSEGCLDVSAEGDSVPS